MNVSDPPVEARRYRKSQTPESPRPLHIPEPSNIPVLQNQMDPVFNDTTTYDIRPSSQPFETIDENGQPLDSTMQGTSAPDRFESSTQQIPVQNSELLARGYNQVQDMSSTIFAENQSLQSMHPSALPSNANDPALNPSGRSIPSGTGPKVPDAASGQGVFPGQTHNTTTYLLPAERASNPNSFIDMQSAQNSGVSPLPTASTQADPPTNAHTQEDQSATHGVNFQSLLDNLSQANPDGSAFEATDVPNPSEANASTTQPQNRTESSLPAVAGLPPRPPPQEKPAIHPNYSANDDIQSYHQMPPSNTHTSSYSGQLPSYRQDAEIAPVNVAPQSPTSFRNTPTAPPAPIPTTLVQSFDRSTPQTLQNPQVSQDRSSVSSPSLRDNTQSTDERPWGSDVQAKFDEFLNDERKYVTEGVWDRFPAGSRLFVGNLPTEKVTKRDLFHIFHKHGRLAQISIKQAYGFVQFLEAAACYEALSVEQGVTIRGRKIHLEISKPQKNTRGAGAGDRGGQGRRRSRSPDRRLGSRSSNGRGSYSDRLPFSDFRDEPARRRDDYRPIRSPSPRSFRARDEYRPRDRDQRWDGRPVSPQYGALNGSAKVFDDEAALPIPRRDPRDVPDVQILVLEDIAQDFLAFIEQGFHAKGLRAQTISLNPRITLAAVIKRQILEGVQAVVKLTRTSQYSGKIPLQVFDRAGGATNVNFNEYVELDVQIAADIVINARQKERLAPAPVPVPYPPQHGYGGAMPQPPYSQHQSQQQPQVQHYQQPLAQPYGQSPAQIPPQYPPQFDPAQQASVAAIQNPQAGGANLQELLANLRQPAAGAQQPIPPRNPNATQSGPPTDLAGLLSNVARQQSQSQAYAQSASVQSPVNQYPNRAPLQSYPNPAAGPAYVQGAQQAPQQNVQNIMEQLARYNK